VRAGFSTSRGKVAIHTKDREFIFWISLPTDIQVDAMAITKLFPVRIPTAIAMFKRKKSWLFFPTAFTLPTHRGNQFSFELYTVRPHIGRIFYAPSSLLPRIPFLPIEVPFFFMRGGP
jgi:hypothetical protein